MNTIFTIKKAILFYLTLTIFQQLAISQVSGLSYTLAPTIEYTLFDDKSGLEDTYLLGAKVGFGFGEYLELRGLYLQTIGQQNDFTDFGLPNFSSENFTKRDVDLTRYGGELKANLGKGKFLPFVTLGTGIQSIKLDTFESNKHIYISAGVGINFSIADRFTVTLEAKNTPYNFNTIKNLLTDSDRDQFGLGENDFNMETLKNNWSAGASLQFYLGGRRPGELSELDQAYLKTFKKGISIPIEPTLAHINFDNDLPYRNAWLFGVYTGIDFNQYIGIRGFYLQAMDDNKLSTNFDHLAMYGGELQLQLNATEGLTPYLMIGGGQISVQDNYRSNENGKAESQAFASGGLGLTLPISKKFNLFGGVRFLLTSGTKLENLQSADQVVSSTMFSVGTRFIIGKKTQPDVIINNIVTNEVDDALAKQEMENEAKRQKLQTQYEQRLEKLSEEIVAAEQKENEKKIKALQKERNEYEAVITELKSRASRKRENLQDSLSMTKAQLAALRDNYEKQVMKLETQLDIAYEKQDMQTAALLMLEKDQAEATLDNIKTAQRNRTASPTNTLMLNPEQRNAKPAGQIQMTAGEFESLIKTVLDNMVMDQPLENEMPVQTIEPVVMDTAILNKLNQRLQSIENTLNTPQKANSIESPDGEEENAGNSKEQQLEQLSQQILELNLILEQNQKEIEVLKKQVKTPQTEDLPPKD